MLRFQRKFVARLNVSFQQPRSPLSRPLLLERGHRSDSELAPWVFGKHLDEEGLAPACLWHPKSAIVVAAFICHHGIRDGEHEKRRQTLGRTWEVIQGVTAHGKSLPRNGSIRATKLQKPMAQGLLIFVFLNSKLDILNDKLDRPTFIFIEVASNGYFCSISNRQVAESP